MRKIIVLPAITLDGVLQGPGGPKEDPSGGFKYGGWMAPYMSPEGRKMMQKQMKQADYLLGRKTFEMWEPARTRFESYWPAINRGAKYVLSRTRKKSDWKRSVFLKSVADIKKLKRSKGPDLQVWGSGELIHLLLKHGLVDEIHLRICPLVLGKGKKLFAHDALPAAFKLTGSGVTPAGVLFAHYQKAGKIRTAAIGG